MSLPEDSRWPRASHWLSRGDENADVVVVGVPAFETSISPTAAHTTPDAIRDVLARYSTFHITSGRDVRDLKVFDAGNVKKPDHFEGELRVLDAIHRMQLNNELLIALGGDNSITYSVMHSRCGDDLANYGLITFDAHFDLRDGISNGSPVRRLIDAGLRPENITQIGINDFSNSASYAQLAKELGITVITRSQLRHQSIEKIVQDQIERITQTAPSGIYVDFDIDVCDRSTVPACPAAAPGGISPDELRQAAFVVGSASQVIAVDITEIDATKDSDDQRTVRLAALVLLEVCAGRLGALQAS